MIDDAMRWRTDWRWLALRPWRSFCLLSIAMEATVPLCLAGGGDYAVSAIPPGLRNNAHAVIRVQSQTFDASNPRRVTHNVTTATTIFSAEGRGHGQLILFYDRFRSISHLEGHVFDALGNEVRALGGEDVHDFSAISDISLYEDSRARSAELYYDKYPYTVSFSYEMVFEGALDWPTWCAQPADDPVVLSRFEVILPDTMQFRYWSNRPVPQPEISRDEGITTYVWKAENLPHLSVEAVEEDLVRRTTFVRTAPSNFVIDEYPGSMSSWRDLGRWYSSLTAGRDALPATAVDDIHRLIFQNDSQIEKIRKVYRYMQSRTRYVSVQLGIGGWQPFDASYVHTNGYGDCKALANYTIALLRQVGVGAYPALIHGGDAEVEFVPEFPSNQFNHVIVCVPLTKDTVWLECTSQTTPMGHLGRFTEGKFALLITPQGGLLVHTPSGASRENVQRRSARVKLTPSGSADCSMRTVYTGDEQDYVRGGIAGVSETDRQQWFLNDLQMQNTTLSSSSIDGLESHDSCLSVTLTLSCANYAAMTGSRYFFVPNLTERRVSAPPDLKTRVSPVRLPYRYFNTDSISFTLPADYAVETLPAEVRLKSTFGEFDAKTIQADERTILYSRSIEIREATIPAGQYQEYRRFFMGIVRADRAQAVLVRKRP